MGILEKCSIDPAKRKKVRVDSVDEERSGRGKVHSMHIVVRSCEQSQQAALRPTPIDPYRVRSRSDQSRQSKPPSYGWNRNRNCLPRRSSRTVYRNRAMVSCSESPALLKCLRTTSANWSLLTRSCPMMRRSEESSPDEESVCEAEFEFEWALALALVWVCRRGASRACEACARRAASAVGERRPMPWERRMRE